MLRGTPLVAPTTPLNTGITPHRRFAFVSLPLDVADMLLIDR